jgi:hypothetical protein
MNEKDTQLDPVFEKMQEDSKKDKELCEPVLQKVLDVLSDELNADSEFKIRHGFTVVGKALVYLAQAMCQSEEHFNTEISAAQHLAIDRMIAATMPKIEDGKIVEEGYDLENLSIRRIMMALGCGVDYVLWRTDMSNYQKERQALEAEEKIKQQSEAATNEVATENENKAE